MAAPRRARTAERFVATVLFTDIVGSTELATEFGDRRWKQVLAMHHAIVRRALKRNRGREIDTAGDGFFATFEQPADAVRCATEVVDTLWERGLRIRAGIHVGEVERHGPKVGGLAVHIGSRVASSADTGEIRVSSTVRDLVVGSDLAFLDRGVCELKGVPGEWRLFAVAREAAPQGVPASAPGTLEEAAAAHRPWYRRPAVVAPIALALVAAAVGAYVLTRPPAPITPGANTVARFDPARNAFDLAASVGGAPSHIAVGDGSVWVLDPAGLLIEVDPESGQEVGTRSFAGTPTGIAYGDDAVWVAAGFGLATGEGPRVFRFDARTDEPPAPIPVEGDIHSIAFGFGSVWTTSKNENAVTRIDAGTRSVAETITVGEAPEGIAVGGGAVWVANSLGQSVSRIDPETNEASAIPLGENPNAVAATDDWVWVASTSGNVLFRIDPQDETRATVQLGASPTAIAADAEAAWVVASEAGGLLRVDAASRTVGQMIRVNGRPAHAAVGGDLVWVTVGPRS